MASSIFIWPGSLTFTGTITFNGPILNGSGTAGAPAYAFSADATTGFYRDAGGYPAVTVSAQQAYRFQSDTMVCRSNSGFAWSSTADPGATPDLLLKRDAAGILAQVNGTNPQIQRLYGYLNGARLTRGSLHTATEAVTLSGATSVTGNLIPVGCFVLGVATSTTTTITGASGYQVGDGTTATRWGDITGTAVGTHSDNANSTANPTGYFAAAQGVTLTAKTSNFTGGVVQVTVFYLTTGSA